MNSRGSRKLSRIGEIDPFAVAPQPQQPAQSSWPDDYDEFSRISRKAKVDTKRIIEGVYSAEQMQLFDSEEYSELHFQLCDILRKTPDDARALIGLGVCSMAVFEPDKATEYFGKVLDIEATFLPGKFMSEVNPGKPEDWLTLAEGIGHLGFVEAAHDICDRVAKASKYPAKTRATATQLKEQIEQDYFAARERIIAGTPNKPKESTFGTARIMSVVTFVIGPIIFALLIGSWFYSSYQMSSGKTLVAASIYRYERLKGGDTTTERNATIESLLDRAQDHFVAAARFNPFSKEAVFVQMKTADLTLRVGRAKVKTSAEWSREELKDYETKFKETKAKVKELELEKTQLNAEQKAWDEFYKAAKAKPDNVLY